MLKQSTARNVIVFMTDAADNASGKTGLTLTITASKDGGAFASISPTVTERGDGWYNVALTTTHTDTLGDLALHITGTGAINTDMVFEVLEALPGGNLTPTSVQSIWDALTSALTTSGSIGKFLVDDITSIKAKTDNLPSDPADASVIAGRFDTVDSSLVAIAGYVDTEVGAIKAKTDNLPADPADASDIATATAAISAAIAALPGYAVKKNNAQTGFPFPMYSSTTGLPMTGLTVTVSISKDGGAFATAANSPTEISNGWYKIDLDAAELNAKKIAIKVTAAGARQNDLLFTTQD